jgi:hypothetical protein
MVQAASFTPRFSLKITEFQSGMLGHLFVVTHVSKYALIARVCAATKHLLSAVNRAEVASQVYYVGCVHVGNA